MLTATCARASLGDLHYIVYIDPLVYDADFAGDIRVIHVPAVANGRRLTVVMDGETDHAVAYLK